MDKQAKTASPGLKICGVKDLAAIIHCLSLQIDYVGFNLYPGSKRFLTATAARSIWHAGIGTLGGRRFKTKAAVVLVNPSVAQVKQVIQEFPDVEVVQFHGTESPETLKTLRSHVGKREVWKAIGVREQSDIARAESYRDTADMILFDNAPTSQSELGGTGQSFPWNWLHEPRPTLPFGIAGGIRPGMLQQLMALQPAVIDVCSGVESAPGVKDLASVSRLWSELHDLVERAT